MTSPMTTGKASTAGTLARDLYGNLRLFGNVGKSSTENDNNSRDKYHDDVLSLINISTGRTRFSRRDISQFNDYFRDY